MTPIVFVLSLLITYTLPWVSTPAITGFTNGAYDLAEWMSIVPSIRSDSLLLTPLLLRIPLVCIAVYLVLSDTRRSTVWLRLAGLVLIVIALLPPLEYFTSASGDGNYQQSFFLALMALILGAGAAFATNNLSPRTIARLAVVPLAIAVMSGTFGVVRALPLVQSFGIGAQVGIGVALFGVVSVIAALWALRSLAKSPRNETG